MSEARLRAFESRPALDAQIASEVAAALIEAVTLRGKASLVVSGGSTPGGFFKALRDKPVDWSRLTVSLADDRWVPPSHADSNERLLREVLLCGPASAAQCISLVTADAHPKAAESTISERLAQLATFDVVVLGMGSDGHFASLFPDSAALLPGLDMHSERTVIASDPPAAAHARMTLTLPRLLDTRHLFVHIVGQEKRTVLERAAIDKDPRSLPIAAVLASESPAAKVYWAP
ncbi:MAG: 6-phosphogluconolactonase [Congregibacter sp.]|nr:6-phosphogluconolactonase [Congregibacter sp.]